MGCAVSYGNHVEVRYLSATPESTQHTVVDTVATMSGPAALPESLDIFFEGNPPPFPYQSLGLIDVQGAKYTTHGEVFDRLKFEAIQRRADAITEVKRLSVQRETGLLFNDKSEEDSLGMELFFSLVVLPVMVVTALVAAPKT
jgi:hypothetical protein